MHKNPALKAQGGAVRSGPKPFISPRPGPAAAPPASPARALLELDGKKWRVVSERRDALYTSTDTEVCWFLRS